MTEHQDRFQVEKPVWKPADSGWWLTIASGVAGAIAWLFPSLTTSDMTSRSVVTILVFVATPALIYLISYRWRWLQANRKKISNYESLHEAWLDVTAKLVAANKTILKLSLDSRDGFLLEIKRITFFRGKIHLILTKVDDVFLQADQEVTVIDSNDGLLLGQFLICENRSNEYVARVGEYIDPLWLGYVISTGESEMRPPPGSVAVAKKGAGKKNG